MQLLAVRELCSLHIHFTDQVVTGRAFESCRYQEGHNSQGFEAHE